MLAALCAAALPDEHLTAAELQRAALEQPPGTDVAVLGDEDAAVVVATRETYGIRSAWVVLIAVDPRRQGRGLGRARLDDAIGWARDAGSTDLQVGNLAPRYLWPGLDYRFTRALALFETAGFKVLWPAHDMAMSTAFRAPVPSALAVERETTGATVDFAARWYPQWVDEAEVALARGGCFAARDGDDTIAFACHSVWRRGWMGPFATHPERKSRGAGSALLAAMCEDLERAGIPQANICWVGPTAFYAKAGAVVSRVYRTMRLGLT